jgi:hypothetical protein
MDGMARQRPPSPPDALVRVPAIFQAGEHTLRIALAQDWRWTVTVDEARIEGSFMTQVEAWEAGVREAARLDQAPPR